MGAEIVSAEPHKTEGFTPGPWDYEDPYDGCCGSYCGVDGCREDHPTGKFAIAGPALDHGWPAAIFTNEADARLIAAAPEMFSALSERDNMLIQNVLVNASGALRRAGDSVLADQIWKIMEWQCEAIQKALGESTALSRARGDEK